VGVAIGLAPPKETMPRIPYHDLEGLPESLVQQIRSRPPLNLYRMLPHAVTLMPGFLQMGLAIRTETELDPKLRELAILRTGALLNASYEVHQHRRVAERTGVSAEAIAAAIAPGVPSALSPNEELVLGFTTAIVQETRAPDALMAQVLGEFGARQACELLLIAGFYMMVSRFLENTGVEIEPHTAF
jgi:alkylhydroperoxidase family enzyme